MKINPYSLATFGVVCLQIINIEAVRAVTPMEGFNKCANALSQETNCPGIDYVDLAAADQGSSTEMAKFVKNYNQDHPSCKSYSTVVQYCLYPLAFGNGDIIGCLSKLKNLETQAAPGSAEGKLFKFGNSCNSTSMFMSQEQQSEYLEKQHKNQENLANMQAQMKAAFAKAFPHHTPSS